MSCAIQARRRAPAAAMVTVLGTLVLAATSTASAATTPSPHAHSHVTSSRQPAVCGDPSLTPGTPTSGSVRLHAAALAPVYLVPDELVAATRDHARSSTSSLELSPDGQSIGPRK